MAESNETIMKQFEIMINTADEALSQRLISEKASFPKRLRFLHRQVRFRYMEAKAIYLLCIGCARGFLMCSGN